MWKTEASTTSLMNPASSSVAREVEAGREEKPKEKAAKPKDQVKEDDKKDEPLPTPLTVKPAQNWCDFFFIIDSMSYNIDMCDFILFMNKLHPVPNIDIKKVNVDASYLETTTNTLVFSYSDAGIMESLLGEFITRTFSILSDISLTS